jgi:hypothetical protein
VVRKKNKYSTAFSSGSLLFKEADAVINNISDPDRFMKGEENIDYSFIPINSDASKKRLGGELTKRLMKLKDPQFIEQYLAGSRQDKLLILFYAVCRTYRLISDFMLQTVLKKWHNLDFEVTSDDFRNFLYIYMDRHPELENLTPLTVQKRSSTVIKMLKELGLIKDGKLIKNEYNPAILKRIVANGDAWFLEILLLNQQERDEITQL